MSNFAEKHEAAYARGQALAEKMLADPDKPVTRSSQFYDDMARCLAAAIGWPTEVVVEKVMAFHRERLDAVPDPSVYPELRGCRDLLDEEERGMLEGGLDQDTIALAKTLNFWRDTKLVQETGKAYCAMAQPEKCRVVYVPESDRGALHAKNIDNPQTYFHPHPPFPPNSPWPHDHPLVFDGVGSGLHLDEMPPEIFPVDPHALCREHCSTVPEATEFMVRYNYFWSNQNLLVHDHHGNSVAFEKTRCRVATRGPNEQGINFITGMGALDPEIRAFQRQRRQKYLDQRGWGWDDSPDGCFFITSQNKWANMTRYIAELSLNPTFDNLKQLMEQRDKDGPMCCTGVKCHPDLPAGGCTLVMCIYLMDEKKLHRRQWRGDVPAFLDAPEIVQFV